MSGLSDLLQHLNTEGWSSRRIEKEATKHGHKLSNATAARYLNGTHPNRPSAETLQALADLFSTDVERLREAAGLPGGGTPFELGPEYARLNGPQREAIRTVARLFLEQNDTLADPAVRDGATSPRPDFPLPAPRRDEYDRAAMAGTSDLDRLDREAAARGEDSQDPGHDHPA